MTQDTRQLKEALVDVRKAYRLLYQYHRRMFDMVRMADEVLSGYRFETFDSADTMLESRWRPSHKNTDYWKTLPFYSTRFVWSKTVTKSSGGKAAVNWFRPGDRVLSLDFSADESWGNGGDEYTEPPEDFEVSAADARSTLEFCLIKATKPMKMSPLAAWYEVDYPDDPTVRQETEDGRFIATYERHDLSSLPTREALKGALTRFLQSAETELGS